MSVGPRKRPASELTPMGKFIPQDDIVNARTDVTGNDVLREFAKAFVLTRFQDGVLQNARVGNNSALVLTDGNRHSYECVLGEYPSPTQTMRRIYYAEFPAYSTSLAAFMERCGHGEEHSLFAQNIDTFRVAEDAPAWVVDQEAGIAYYLCFRMQGLINERVRHVLFASTDLGELEHFLATVLVPRGAHQRRSTSSRQPELRAAAEVSRAAYEGRAPPKALAHAAVLAHYRRPPLKEVARGVVRGAREGRAPSLEVTRGVVRAHYSRSDEGGAVGSHVGHRSNW
jgi:hypothetical protein